jgi:hypothetical protein
MLKTKQNRDELGTEEIGDYLTKVANEEDNVTVDFDSHTVYVKNGGSEFMGVVVDSVLRLPQFEEESIDARFPPIEPLNGTLRAIRVPHDYIEDIDTYIVHMDITTIKNEEAFEQFKENVGVVDEEIIDGGEFSNKLLFELEDGTMMNMKEPFIDELGVNVGRISMESKDNQMVYKIRDELICKTSYRKCSYDGRWFTIEQEPN